jgi:hypothetical protein
MTDPISPIAPTAPVAPRPPFPGRPGRPTAGGLLAAALLAAACGGPAMAQQGELDMGDPSVQSQRGQRLKLVLPFGSAPGERVSPTRFEVVSVRAPEGWQAPDPGTFTISKAARRNLVYLQSRELVDAPELTVAIRVAGQTGDTQTWRFAVPPAQATAAPVSADAGPGAAPRPPGRKAAARSTRQRAAPTAL